MPRMPQSGMLSNDLERYRLERETPGRIKRSRGSVCEAVFALGEHVPSSSWSLGYVADAKYFSNAMLVRWSHAG